MRGTIERCNSDQAASFRAGADIGALTRERAQFVDRLITNLWESSGWSDGQRAQVSLLAVGGYGRGELSPHSDIDLLVLIDQEAGPQSAVQQPIEKFVMRLWDSGLDVGHSVRTIAQCADVARVDVTIITSLMEARTLCGDDRLRQAMRQATGPHQLWSSAEFYRAKLQEQAARHRRFDHIDYNLEPNVKGGPGGLRDIQTVRWVAHRHFGTSDIAQLVTLGFITRDEHDVLTRAQRFLTRVRFGLHLLAARREDRLGFEYQRELASAFGYRARAGQLAVEQFMHDYYRHVLEVQAVSDVLLQHFDEAILRGNVQEQITPLDAHFRIQGDYIDATHAGLFREYPSGLLEIFVIMAHRPDIHGVRATTIRLIREHLHLIDDAFRNDRHNADLFMRLMRAPHELVTQLTRMRRYGVLGRYLPEFGRVIGQMQHDLFHIYTVDAHTLQVIRNMRRFAMRTSQADFPLACEIANRLPKIELLYLSGLFHDIAKGRGGDHSELGAGDVAAFCARHSLNDEDQTLLSWLVRAHLVMSATAQRQDISDPDVIYAFAEQVQSADRLDYLYALTVADITATNPTLWNSWRATLMSQLYRNTRDYLLGGRADRMHREARIESIEEQALASLEQRGVPRNVALSVWDHPPPEYFLRYDIDEIVWQTQEMARHDLDRGPLVLVRNLGLAQEGGTEVFLYTRNQRNLFAASVAALDQLNLSIQDARIHTSSGGLCFNTYIVLGADGRPIGNDPAFIDHIRETLAKELRHADAYPQIVSRRVPRNLRQFAIPTTAEVVTRSTDGLAELRVVAADRPGLLARLGMIFMELNVSVHGARITTLGERVEDVFQISTEDHHAAEAARVAALTDQICRRLDEEL